MSRTLITIGTHANAGLNTFRMCFSKASAILVLMARGIPRHAARYAVNRALALEASGIVAGLRAAPCGLYVQSRLHDAEAGYFARSYSELKALWQKAPEQ